MERFELNYRPTEKQLAFHRATANEALYGGAAGGGKSKALVMDALARCLAHPGTHAYLFRRTYRELEDTLIAEARASIPKGLGLYNGSRHEIALVNGSVLHFRHCRSTADMYDYAGTEMHWLYIDELTGFELPVYEYLKTRLRAKASLGFTPVVRCATNPGGIGHAWVRARFVEAGLPMKPAFRTIHSQTLGRAETVSTLFIPALAAENPHVGDAYIFELEQKPDALRRALLLGDWNAFEGQVFSEFKDDPDHYADGRFTHVVKPFEVPGHWVRYMSFDHGYTAPFSVGWWAVSPGGVAYRYREWYGWNGTPNHGLTLSPGEIAAGILEREEEERREGRRFDRIADPAIFERSRGDSIAQQMAAAGVIFRKGDHARLAGKMQLHGRLRFDPQGKPGLYVFDCCRQFIRTVPALPYDITKSEDIDTAAEDHIYDETRYFLMARPYGRGGTT
ncbi:MAG: phage terminase large subunit [Oscillospiraceae bacterium]|jgi:hypothetical protein|nr:phage terminase large subunit [Oscillospiraceae bacterium]